MNTIFSVNGQGYEVKGVGQSAVTSILKQFPTTKVILVGFMINKEFIKAEI
jgi:hypothetical protein